MLFLFLTFLFYLFIFLLQHGHSTPQMAARFVKKINGKKLLMTHFSSRYRGDEADFSMRIMWRMEQMARKVSDLWGKNDVIAAWDHMCLPVRTREDELLITEKENAIRESVDNAHLYAEKMERMKKIENMEFFSSMYGI